MHPNTAKIQSFVAGHIAIASGKSPLEAEAHLFGWAAWLNGQMALLDRAKTPAHLVGVTAFDLANARDELLAAATRRAA